MPTFPLRSRRVISAKKFVKGWEVLSGQSGVVMIEVKMKLQVSSPLPYTLLQIIEKKRSEGTMWEMISDRMLSVIWVAQRNIKHKFSR